MPRIHRPTAPAAAIAASITAALTITAAHAGPLTPPPGAPSNTNTLTLEADARIPITSLPAQGTALHVVTEPGSYYLTANLGGPGINPGELIRVDADNATIDLNGFTLDATNGAGILLTADNTTIRNGTITGAATTAVLVDGAAHTLIDRVVLIDNNFAIASTQQPFSFEPTRIQRAAFIDNTVGIQLGTAATITDSAFTSNDTSIAVGRRSLIARCTIRDAFTADAIIAGNASVITDTIVEDSNFGAITIGIESLVERVFIANAMDHGIDAGSDTTIRNATIRVIQSGPGVISKGDGLIEHCNVDETFGDAYRLGTGSTVRSSVASRAARGFVVADSIGAGTTKTAATLHDCIAQDNSQDGFTFDWTAIAINCLAANNGDDGFQFAGGTQIRNSQALDNTFGFFYAPTATTPPRPNVFHLDGNLAQGNSFAQFSLSNGSGVVTRNTAVGSNAFVIAGGSILGQIISGSTTLTGSESPFANFDF